ncbi:nucleoside-diphosphate sugar epimerase/dehydratase [Achromobacter veterisilvae]|uniref:Nucleoside-diphosphate sugar epimerase/dehydratase n=1 Tax=Achromobacter veterisilvae TaxID=2069367 RepID=A0ABZ2S123_9BURK
MILPFAIRRLFVDLPRPAKQALAIALDALILLVSFYLALWLRFELFFLNTSYFALSLAACAGGVLSMAGFRVYNYILRYMNERVILGITAGVTVSVMVVTTANTFLQLLGLSRAVLVIYGSLAIAGLVGTRWVARRVLFTDTKDVSDLRIPVVIYGAGGAGSQLATALRAGPHYKPVAMLDDDRRKHGLMVAGLRIHPPGHLPTLVERHGVRQLLIAMPSAGRARLREIVESAEQYRLRIRLVPSLRELVDSNGLRLRDVQVEDLLGRDPVAPISELLGRCVTARNVMVTGAGGSIGSELCRQIIALNPTRLVLYETSEPALYTIEQELIQLVGQRPIELIAVLGSVRDHDHSLHRIKSHDIQTIYHAAAYKHVPMVEQNVAEGIATNALGTLSLARAAITAGVSDFVLISTDKAVRPTNVMGASKRLAELILQSLSQRQHTTRFSMVRFGNVLGSSGSVVPLFHRQILAGGPVTLTHSDITRYFMTIPEAAQLVLQAGAMGESGSVFVLDMGEPVRIRDLAERMVRLCGLTIRDESDPDGDIELRVVGLRPGEKLYEELLIGGDVKSTLHPRIMQARENDLPYDMLVSGLEQMEQSLASWDRAQIVAALKSLVAEFNPKTEEATSRQPMNSPQ